VDVGAEELPHAVDGELLGHVDEFASAVIALAGIAFGVLVGELRALGGEYRRTDIVLGSDQLDVVFLALVLLLDRCKEVGIDPGEIALRGEHGASKNR